VQNLVELDSAVKNLRMREKTRFRVDFFVNISVYLSVYISIYPSRFSSGLQVTFWDDFNVNPTPPVVSLLPPELPSRTIAWTVSSELIGFCFYFFVIFRFCAVP